MEYTFRHIKTHKIKTVQLSIAEYDAYLASHPKLERWLESAPVISHKPGFENKIPSGFKDVLQKIGETNPYTELGDNYRKNKTIKEIKTRDVVRNFAKKQAKSKLKNRRK